MLVQQNGYIGGRCLTAQYLQGREAHHDRGHLIFIHKDDSLREFLIIADAAVTAEQVFQQLGDVIDNKVLLCMADPQILTAQSLCVTVDHHRNSEIIRHPAVAEHGFDVARLYDELAERHHDLQPSGVVI